MVLRLIMADEVFEQLRGGGGGATLKSEYEFDIKLGE